MKHLTIRNIPEDVSRRLAEEKHRRAQSLNQVVIDLLRQSVGADPARPFDNGLSRLAGTWTARDLRSFEAATRCFEEVDEEMWR
jgi:plasmid stability protein